MKFFNAGVSTVILASFFVLATPSPALASTQTYYYPNGYEVTTTATGRETNKYIPAGPVTVLKKDNGETYYLHPDQIASTALITNKEGNKVQEMVYYPYGKQFKTAAQNSKADNPTDHLYTSQIKDNQTNLYFYNARYYNPQTASFISADYANDPANRGNRYLYVGGNPIVRNDPGGMGADIKGGRGEKKREWGNDEELDPYLKHYLDYLRRKNRLNTLVDFSSSAYLDSQETHVVEDAIREVMMIDSSLPRDVRGRHIKYQVDEASSDLEELYKASGLFVGAYVYRGRYTVHIPKYQGFEIHDWQFNRDVLIHEIGHLHADESTYSKYVSVKTKSGLVPRINKRFPAYGDLEMRLRGPVFENPATTKGYGLTSYREAFAEDFTGYHTETALLQDPATWKFFQQLLKRRERRARAAKQ